MARFKKAEVTLKDGRCYNNHCDSKNYCEVYDTNGDGDDFKYFPRISCEYCQHFKDNRVQPETSESSFTIY